MVKLLYFAALVDRLGTAAEEMELPAEAATVLALLAHLRERGDHWEKAFVAGTVRVTVIRQFADLDAPIKDGDEIAFISAWV